MPGSGVTILFGGTSNERRVSVASAQNVAGVLDEAAAWFLALSGAVFEIDRGELKRFEKPFERDFVPSGPARFATLVEAFESETSRSSASRPMAIAPWCCSNHRTCMWLRLT